MKKVLYFGTLMLLMAVSVSFAQKKKKDGWISIFDGKSMDGWKVGENASTFSLENGTLKVAGPRAHIF